MENNDIYISVGEASADFHASNLVKEIQREMPKIKICGMGGKLMRESGVDILIDSSKLAIVGGTDVLKNFHKIFAVMRTVKRLLKTNPPKLIILIDYPGFNLWLAKTAKKYNIKVLYYISPQIWAWHQSRIKKIKKYVDFMAVVFPFEVKIYAKAKVPAAFVGHPLVKTVKPTMSATIAKNTFTLNQENKIIGLFPGSRHSEIKLLLPLMLEAAKLLQNKYHNLQFVLPLASSINEEEILAYTRNIDFKINIIKNKNYDVMNVCDAIIATSGTVTLEIALMAIPLVIIYKMAAFNYFFAKRLVKIPFIGLCNIVAEEKIAEELIQENATPENIFQEIDKILSNSNYREEMILKLRETKNKLENSNQQQNIVTVIKQMLKL